MIRSRLNLSRVLPRVLGASVVLLAATSASAQLVDNPQGIYQPLDQLAPPGRAAEWFAFQGKASPLYFQPVRVELPTTGQVTVYGPTPQTTTQLQAPALVGLGVGHLYRLRISDMPEYPGLEIYPSVEMLDRLHPPAGRAHEFPIPLQLTAEEIEMVMDGRMVTRVLYLEQPQLAAPRGLETPMRVTTIASNRNLLAEADLLGRPMLILRIGGRVPDPTGQPDPTFYGSGIPPIRLPLAVPY